MLRRSVSSYMPSDFGRSTSFQGSTYFIAGSKIRQVVDGICLVRPIMVLFCFQEAVVNRSLGLVSVEISNLVFGEMIN